MRAMRGLVVLVGRRQTTYVATTAAIDRSARHARDARTDSAGRTPTRRRYVATTAAIARTARHARDARTGSAGRTPIDSRSCSG